MNRTTCARRRCDLWALPFSSFCSYHDPAVRWSLRNRPEEPVVRDHPALRQVESSCERVESAGSPAVLDVVFPLDQEAA